MVGAVEGDQFIGNRAEELKGTTSYLPHTSSLSRALSLILTYNLRFAQIATPNGARNSDKLDRYGTHMGSFVF